jgi:hypothetical protein
MSRRLLILVLLLGIILLLAIYGIPLWNRLMETPAAPNMATAIVFPTPDFPPAIYSPTNTPHPLAATPTAGNGVPAKCVQALAITSKQIGQTLCIGGIVDQALGKKGDYYIFFKQSDPNILYFVSFGWPASGAAGVRKGECIYLESVKIIGLGEHSLMSPFLPKDLMRCKATTAS